MNKIAYVLALIACVAWLVTAIFSFGEGGPRERALLLAIAFLWVAKELKP